MREEISMDDYNSNYRLYRLQTTDSQILEKNKRTIVNRNSLFSKISPKLVAASLIFSCFSVVLDG